MPGVYTAVVLGSELKPLPIELCRKRDQGLPFGAREVCDFRAQMISRDSSWTSVRAYDTRFTIQTTDFEQRQVVSRLGRGLTRIEVVVRQIYLVLGDEAGDSHGLSFWNKTRRVCRVFVGTHRGRPC